MNDDFELFRLIFFFTILIVIGIIYSLPTIIAFHRKHPNRWLIMLVNVVFGTTILGWGIALIWALRIAHTEGSKSSGGESGLNLFANDTKKIELVRTKSGDQNK